MKRRGCSRHGAVGACSRCYLEERRAWLIYHCQHIRLQYLPFEWRRFEVGGIPTMTQEIATLVCSDCPATFETCVEESIT